MNPFRKLGRSAEKIKQKATGSNDGDSRDGGEGSNEGDLLYVCTGCEKTYDDEVTVCLECDGTDFVTVEV